MEVVAGVAPDLPTFHIMVVLVEGPYRTHPEFQGAEAGMEVFTTHGSFQT
jgi:hypothetical protein